MTEFEPNPNKEPSPRELYTQVKQLYHLIPTNTIFGEYDEDLSSLSQDDFNKQIALGVGDLMRRRESEQLPLLQKKLASVIKYAPITDSFGREITRLYGNAYATGRFSENNPIISMARKYLPSQFIFEDILELNDEQSIGIFDPEKAKMIEARSYRAKVKVALGQKEIIDRLNERMGGLAGETPLYHSEETQNAGRELQRWRDEYVEKYGIEP